VGGRAESDISMSSSADEDEAAEANTALLTGMTRAAARRGRFFEGVSGAKTPSSSSEAETASESEKATLRFALLVRDGVKFASRIADLVGDADRDCEGVLMGVFDGEAGAAPAPEVSTLAIFLRNSLIVARMDSFKSSQSSSIILNRRLKTSSGTPYLSAKDMCCTFENWARR
jgi:hypothetical protein